MKRRPHWDDDLIAAVCATGDDGEVDYWMTSDQVYRIIAAVEDWHTNQSDHDEMSAIISMGAYRGRLMLAEERIKQLEAQLAEFDMSAG